MSEFFGRSFSKAFSRKVSFKMTTVVYEHAQ